MTTLRPTRLLLALAAVVVVGPPPGPARGADPRADGPHALVVVKEGRFLARAGGEVAEIADLTAHCLHCHGGGAPGEAATGAPAAEHDVTGLGRSHPVDVAYPDGTPGYRPLSAVGEALPLGNGRVTCLSCHAGTPDRALLLPLKGGGLCTACHVK